MRAIHILLVEDNEGDVILTKEALEETKVLYSIDVAIDGDIAIDILNKTGEFINCKTPDLIFLDINLPKKNGHEVLKFIKSTNRLKHIPVVMLTTSSYEKDINQAYQNYANCFITKCVEMDEFIDAVAKIINFWVYVVKLPSINFNESQEISN